ncbi:hypothetical protein AVEN_148779-1 [Araneus ventricosus]|uniref:Uncharacterized protein n=1 Tax=Araneus ventricosus TaxID=182803 RepID=A0A4Y2SYK4_ARAVE|nr:hypothetical protein AVEN_148779-1 [Araneus ventricosus]
MFTAAFASEIEGSELASPSSSIPENEFPLKWAPQIWGRGLPYKKLVQYNLDFFSWKMTPHGQECQITWESEGERLEASVFCSSEIWEGAG